MWGGPALTSSSAKDRLRRFVGLISVPFDVQNTRPWSWKWSPNTSISSNWRVRWPGTGSYLVFYHLNRLKEGDEVLLKDREGKVYRYRVSEVMEVNPDDVWVMGQVVGRDMVTLQTCTPIPTFDKRLIVRADRI